MFLFSWLYLTFFGCGFVLLLFLATTYNHNYWLDLSANDRVEAGWVTAEERLIMELGTKVQEAQNSRREELYTALHCSLQLYAGVYKSIWLPRALHSFIQPFTTAHSCPLLLYTTLYCSLLLSHVL